MTSGREITQPAGGLSLSMQGGSHGKVSGLGNSKAKNLRRHLRKMGLILDLKMKLSIGTIMLYNKQL